MLLYKTKRGQILTDDDIDLLDTYQVQELGIHVIDDSWDEWN